MDGVRFDWFNLFESLTGVKVTSDWLLRCNSFPAKTGDAADAVSSPSSSLEVEGRKYLHGRNSAYIHNIIHLNTFKTKSILLSWVYEAK